MGCPSNRLLIFLHRGSLKKKKRGGNFSGGTLVSLLTKKLTKLTKTDCVSLASGFLSASKAS